MTLQTPSTADIRSNIVSQLEAAFGQTIPLLPKSFLAVLAGVIAAVYVILYRYAGFIALQQFVQTASIDETTINGVLVSPLKEWGRLVGIGEPKAATAAELSLRLTVLTQGDVLPSSTQFIRADTGVTYLSVAAVNLDASTVLVTVRAASDQAGGGGLGTIGNLDVGDEVLFVTPIAAVEGTTSVDSVVTTAADAEPVDEYRQRILDRFQKRPQGGAYADYEQWGEETAGIKNVYPFTGLPGQVDLYCESSTEPDGIPTQDQLDAVLESVNFDENGLASRRPAGAYVNALPITRLTFDVRITGLQVDDTAQVQQDIEAALTDYFLERENYIEGLTIPPRQDRITDSAVGGLVEDIVTAAGGIFGTANVLQGGTLVGGYSLQEGEKAKLGVVTYL